MLLATDTALIALWIVLSVFLVVVGIALTWSLIRLAGMLQRMTGMLEQTEQSVVPLFDKLGTTLDLTNLQLDKLDIVTDSAVDAADAADTAVRAVSMVITRPVQKASALAKGISQGASALFAGNDVKTSLAAARDAAARREREIAEELSRTDARRQAYLRPDHRSAFDLPSEPAPSPVEPPSEPAPSPVESTSDQ